MKKLLQSILLTGCAVSMVWAQTPNVNKFTKVDVNILAIPEKGTVVPTTDGGYFMSKGLKLTKYDSNNTEVWSQTLTGTNKVGNTHKITYICEDGQGGAIITGQVHGTLSLGNDSITAYTAAGTGGYYSADAFIARINQTGKLWWHRFGEYNMDAPETDKGVSVKLLNNKVYWLAHGTARNLRFGNFTYPLSGYPGNVALLCQFTIDGVVDWVNVTKGGGIVPVNLAVSATGIFYNGYSLGSSTAINFGNSKTLSYNQASFFAVKYDNAGLAQWAVTYDDDNSLSNLKGLAVDDESNIYVTGGGSNYSSSYGIRKASGYLIKMNGTNGEQVWTRIFTGQSLKGPEFSGGKIYVSNNTMGTLYLQSSVIDSVMIKVSTSNVGAEQFIASFDKAGTLTGSLKGVAAPAGNSAMEYLESNNNRVIVMGSYSNGNMFGNVTIPSSGGNVGVYHIGFFNVATGSGGSTGINQDLLQQLNVIYPNPATDLINVSIPKEFKNVNISLLSIEGKIIEQYNTSLPETTMNIGSLEDGIYFIRMEHHGNVAVKKFIKQ